MECNKDEAMRAKEIAEKKFDAKDFKGAKKFALKAQNLYPGLEGISQMLATFDVYICASSKTNGESDWYHILGINPSADDETVKKQYKKLALMLHPDKNKSIGAEGAFQLISEALNVLSDKSRRALYDQRRTSTVVHQKSPPPPRKERKAPAAGNGFFDFAKPNVFSGSGTAQQAKPGTFWTVCYRCKLQFEYLRIYCNQYLLCQNCHQPFLTIEKAAPSAYGFNIPSLWRRAQPISGGFGDANSEAIFRWTPFSQGDVSHGTSTAQQAYGNAVREFEEALATERQGKGIKRKYEASEKLPCASSAEHVTSAKKRRDAEKPFDIRDLSQVETCNILVEKARAIIYKKISANKSKAMPNGTIPMYKAGDKSHNEDNGMKTPDIVNQKRPKTSVGRKSVILTDGISSAVVATEADNRTSNSFSISVPDPDFYDFDKDRTESSFQEKQVWAAYDNDDGMPRFYAMIQAVSSRNPFKVRISWLNSKTNAELGPLNWVGSGFLKTCGDFRIGKYEVNDKLNSFSHIVRWRKDTGGVIRIFPMKGDVWALYQNWSPDWNELTPGEIIHKYNMVEVLEDCDEETGVLVTPLVKVSGFKTVFRQALDHGQTKRIPKEEMFRFSHQVPRHLLTAEETSDFLKGCMELDPAATPTDLLHLEKA